MRRNKEGNKDIKYVLAVFIDSPSMKQSECNNSIDPCSQERRIHHILMQSCLNLKQEQSPDLVVSDLVCKISYRLSSSHWSRGGPRKRPRRDNSHRPSMNGRCWRLAFNDQCEDIFHCSLYCLCNVLVSSKV